ncbi:prepilin-type N-terminal cleavage/methylation domain-containing protein [Thalassomonas sp. M1454]|uniref:prepilin-type N-terminal cleavage/methylation domain-containing protein n=1 Tax=Thalassomonas sp. M1454 TaxID=2594477 RepID=UPI00117DD190|nr:prepilin-type N-terminal cleavage/methylation domain-containing protein [Thalassomonas sp. M1454]TRX52802.1 prepilin-type N-terminal cleavage/methylation domain-containing protein [Thalassomonas sp. M1454]
MPVNASKFQQGFTLIELVIGMTVMVVAIGFMMAAMLPREKQSADQIHLIRAAELGQSLMNEITSKSFDENTDRTGGLLRCNETGAVACTGYDELRAEAGESRANFDDVDDFNGLTNLSDALGEDIAQQYFGFNVSVNVTYDNNYNGTFDAGSDDYSGNIITNTDLVKRITIVVTTPLGTPITFANYKANIE